MTLTQGLLCAALIAAGYLVWHFWAPIKGYVYGHSDPVEIEPDPAPKIVAKPKAKKKPAAKKTAKARRR